MRVHVLRIESRRERIAIPTTPLATRILISLQHLPHPTRFLESHRSIVAVFGDDTSQCASPIIAVSYQSKANRVPDNTDAIVGCFANYEDRNVRGGRIDAV